MKRIFILLLFFPAMLFSQEYISKTALYNGTFVKLETGIKVTDSVVTINSKDYSFDYIVENKIKHFYQLDLYGIKYTLNIVETTGKSKGFFYNFAFALINVNDPNQTVTYYAILNNEED